MSGYSGVFAIYVKGNGEQTIVFLKSLKVLITLTFLTINMVKLPKQEEINYYSPFCYVIYISTIANAEHDEDLKTPDSNE